MTPAFYQTVIDTSGEVDREVIERGTTAVLGALRDRLTAEEARDVAAQLPAEIKPLWAAADQRARQEPATNEQAFFERVMNIAGVRGTAEARWITLAVFAALKRRLALRETAMVVSRLPEDLRQLWIEAQPKSADDERVDRLERRLVELERRVLEVEKELGRMRI
jgi:uncharacterized protein (DUF2267 family)